MHLQWIASVLSADAFHGRSTAPIGNPARQDETRKPKFSKPAKHQIDSIPLLMRTDLINRIDHQNLERT